MKSKVFDYSQIEELFDKFIDVEKDQLATHLLENNIDQDAITKSAIILKCYQKLKEIFRARMQSDERS